MSGPRVRLEDGVAAVELEAGAGGAATVRELADLLTRLAAEEETRVVRLLDRGGALARTTRTAGPPREAARELIDAFLEIESCRRPVLAEVAGAATGWGCELLLAADVVLAAEGADFALTPSLADHFPAYGLLRGPDVVGAHWSKLMAFSGLRFDAATMHEAGLVQAVHGSEELDGAGAELAAAIAAGAPLGVEVGKSLAGRQNEDGGREHAIEALAAALEERG